MRRSTHGRGHPLRAAVPGALRDRARDARASGRWCCCGCATRRARSGSAKRCRCRCAAARSLEQVVAELRVPGPSDAGRWRTRPDSRRRRAARSRPRCSTWPRGARGFRPGLLLGAATAEPVRCNATLAPASPQAVAAQRCDWAAAGFDTFKLKVGGRRTSIRCGRCAGASAGARSCASTPTQPGARRRRFGAWKRWPPRESSLAEQPVRDARGAWREVARRVEIPIAADESVTEVADARAGVPARRLRPGHREALQGRRTSGRGRDLEPSSRPISPAPSTARSGSPPPPTPRRSLREQARRCRHRPRPRHPAPLRRDDRLRSSASCATASCICPAAPAWASRSTMQRCSDTGSNVCSARLWTRPTATPPSPRPSSRSWPAAGCATRSSPPARARRRWRWRSGASRQIEVTVIVDERSAGFFALGAAQATRRAGGGALHLGNRRRQLPPGGLRGRRIGRAADRC